jgi:hypothetical protein
VGSSPKPKGKATGDQHGTLRDNSGTGHYLPENEITNATFAEWMGAVSPKLAEVVGKFEASSGIKNPFLRSG